MKKKKKKEKKKDLFLRLAEASTFDDLAYFGAVIEVQEDGCYSDFDDLDDLDDFDFDLFTGLPF